MNDSDLVLIRTSNFLGIGSLRKKLQPFKDHRKNEKIGDQRRCNQNINENLPKNVQKIMKKDEQMKNKKVLSKIFLGCF